MSKKICTIIITIVIIMGILNYSEASSFRLIARADETEVIPGQEVTISLNLSDIDMGEHGINVVEGYLKYEDSFFSAMEMVDKLRDTSQSHDRCTVVEVMGRNAGYIAVNTGIACGAIEIITREVPYAIDAIAKKMLEAKANGKQNFVIVVSEGIGNANEIAKIIEEKTHIESRATILGHVQRGGSPTVRDRVLAAELGHYAVGLLEQGIGNRVVGIQKDEIVDFDIQEALSMKKAYETELHKIAEQIAI
ncbi:MAG TPA: 6-phosphofructokinase [Ruminococcus sp.]